MLNFGEKATWIVCPTCGKEVNKLREGNMCWDCVEDDIKRKEKEFFIDKKIENLFGSQEAIKWYTFDNWDPIVSLDRAYTKAFNFEPYSENLYLWGKVGRGKTHLAYAIAIKQLKAGLSIDILSPRELAGKFRRKNFEDEIFEMDKLRKVDVLILDDIGKGQETQFALGILAEVLNKRALNKKNGLVITSNLSLDELSNKFADDRLSSRLAGLCESIEMQSDDDYRIAGKI